VRSVQLVLAIHNHQPVGNFDHVFEAAYDQAYLPFLECMDRFPDIRFAMHVSGPLLEWIEDRRPDYVRKVADMVRDGRIEIMGGGHYEPILTMLPERDRVGQIESFSRHLRNRLGATVRGAWLAERVWEACLAASLAEAGIEYSVVDDFHFKCAGLRQADLCGYYVTEDQGRVLRIFPGSERMRYTIPFADPEKTIEFLDAQATEPGDRVVVYADDGEKFGVWPKTHKHVYDDGWLVRFLSALRENAAWIRIRTFAEVLADTPPLGRIYLPDCSYREMTEWALPAEALMEYEDLEREMEVAGFAQRVRPFVRGGTWRNFKSKYVEGAQMYARMLEASEAVHRSRAAVSRRERARRELYRGQCNCAYWHGVFGGLYLPFLRFETYRRLIAVERLVEPRRSRPQVDISDFDLDGRPEIRFTTNGAKLYLKPDRGGHAYEWDDLDKSANLMANFTRRREAYHRKLLEAAARGGEQEDDVASIHDKLVLKEEGLEKRLIFDRYVRESLVDHVYAGGVSLDAVASGEAAELGEWHSAPYEFRRVRNHAVQLSSRGRAAVIEKTVAPDGDRGFEIRVRVAPEPEAAPAIYAMELNVNLLAGDAPDRYYVDAEGTNLGPLRSRLDLNDAPALSLVDEWLGVEFRLRAEPPAGVWTHPVETVSESEGGFERVYQSSAVYFYWPFHDGLDAVIHAEVHHR